MALAMLVCCFTACAEKPEENVPTPPNVHVHSTVLVQAKAAQYAQHGNKEYYKCSCGDLFEDKAATKPTTENAVKVLSETMFDKKSYTNNGYSLNYCLYEPTNLNKSSDKVPLVLFLHGAGERGSDNQAQLKNAILKVVNKNNTSSNWMNSVIIAPQCPLLGTNSMDINDYKWVDTLWSKGNYVQENVPENERLNAVANLVNQYATYDYIDEDRVYVVGLSMGGFGTWDIISRYPNMFAAAVPICGGGPIDKINVLKDIPIYTFHGTADSSVPYSGTQEMYNAIIGAGGEKITFYTFSGKGHGIWNDAITFGGSGTQYPALEDWLFSQSK